MEVKAWHEKVKIPTYPIGQPEKNPVFIENRVYQGSSGKVYPHPVVEMISDEKIDKIWNAVFIENAYLKIMVLPELGGRIQMAFDKTKQRHFVYYNQVIKPALVGLLGPWISGGIEFNWPQHHRPSTYHSVDVDIEKNKDGSITIWCNEVELMFRTKGMAGFTLHPDKAYLEIKVKLYNRTPHPQTFLWWANPAVKVNDFYQSVFPPDVHAIYDHGKRDVSDFPIATGTYYKVDYSPGTDISKYKNIPVPTSYMAVNSAYDFVGGYENDSKGGLLHVANHHLSPGKKQWTWGHSDFGLAWDRNLTDEDGPYIELMCGVYTDNQPDFSWLMPYEERSFKQYFMPYYDLGLVKNACKEVLINLEFIKQNIVIKLYSTCINKGSTILLEANGKVVFKEKINLTPGSTYERKISKKNKIPKENYELKILEKNGKTLINYQPEKRKKKEIPQPARPAKLPSDIKEIEQLYLTGLHIEQYRHATYSAKDYYQEALKRSPRDLRNNNALGLWLMRNGQFVHAQSYFEQAIETITERNPNPYDGEPYFNLGQCLIYQGRIEEAYTAFYKATWNAAWQGGSFFALAQIVCSRKAYGEALEMVEKALVTNWHNHKARALKASLLIYLDEPRKAKKWIKDSLKIDPFNMSILYQKQLMDNKKGSKKFHKLMRGYIHNYIEYALDYAQAGLYKEAIMLLEEGVVQSKKHPMAYYFLGWFAVQAKEIDQAHFYFEKARKLKTDYCFPYRLEGIRALETALHHHPQDFKAHYYLGNLWYDKKQYKDAIKHWEKSKTINDVHPTIHRNLALAYFNKKNNKSYKTKALKEIKRAFELDRNDARILFEYDQLRKRFNHSLQNRTKYLTANNALVVQRDDLYLENITLKNQLGLIEEKIALHEEALDLIMNRKFHPWEGGEGKVTGQFVLSHTELAKKYIEDGAFKKAMEHLEATEQYPFNLGEGKLYGAKENDILFWKGMALTGLGKKKAAKTIWQQAARGKVDLTISMYYNDQSPDKIFYQALALEKLRKKNDAKLLFRQLLDYGKAHRKEKISIDYFAVSLPDLAIWDDDLNKRNYLHCLYLMGLGYLGLCDYKKAIKSLKEVLELNNCHSGAAIAMNLCTHSLNNQLF